LALVVNFFRQLFDVRPSRISFVLRSLEWARRLIETRLWSSGDVGFRVRSVNIVPRETQVMPIASDIKGRIKYLANASVHGPIFLRRLRKLYWFLKGAFRLD